MSERESDRYTTIQVPEGHVCVNQPQDFQGVTLWLGDNNVTTVGDGALYTFGDGFKPIVAAVVVARLRAIADLIETNHRGPVTP